MDKGWTKSYRSKWAHPVFRNLLEAAIWSWICDTAVWEDTRVRFNGAVVQLKRGQLITTRSFISKGFQIGEQVTRTFLENLEKDGMINLQTNQRGTIITICNYDEYQGNENTDNPLDNQQPTNGQPTANHNKKKLRTKEEKELVEIPEWLSAEAWKNYIDHRGKDFKPTAQKLAIGKLSKWRDKGYDPAEILNNSVMNGWVGLFEPKGKQMEQHKKPTAQDENWRMLQEAAGVA